MILIKPRSVLVRQWLQLAAVIGMSVVGMLATLGLVPATGLSGGRDCYFMPPPLLHYDCYGSYYILSLIGMPLLIGGWVLAALVVLRMLRSGLFVGPTSVTMYELVYRWSPVSRAMTIPKAQVADVMVVWSTEELVYGVPNSRQVGPTGRVVVQLVDGRKLSGAGLAYWLPVSQSRRTHIERHLDEVMHDRSWASVGIT